MKHENLLEKELQSWAPRQPSARIRARLFPASAEAAEPTYPAPAAWHWLAPVAAVFLLTMMVTDRQSSGLTPWLSVPPSNLLATVAFSHPNLVSFYDANRQCARNALSGASFEWTNGGQPVSTAPRFFNTNYLMP